MLIVTIKNDYMKKLMLFAAILFSALFKIHGQNENTFVLKANWHKKDVKEMVYIRSISFMQNGVENSISNDTVSKYQISVVHKNKKGYRVEWKLMNASTDYRNPAYLNDYISQYYYVIETDRNGSFKELSNWEVLLKLNNELKEEFIENAKKDHMSQEDVNDLLAQMKLAETKDELIEMCKDLTDILHGIYGQELPLNDTIYEQTIIPNDYIKNGIPATRKTVTTDLGNDLIQIRYEIIYDLAKQKELFIEAFPDQEYIEDTLTSISDYFYNCKTGWIERICFYNESVSSQMTYKSILEYIIK